MSLRPSEMPDPDIMAEYLTRHLVKNNVPPDGVGTDLLTLTERALPIFQGEGKLADRLTDLYTEILTRSESLSRGLKANRSSNGRKGLTCEGCLKLEEGVETTFKHCSGVRTAFSVCLASCIHLPSLRAVPACILLQCRGQSPVISASLFTSSHCSRASSARVRTGNIAELTRLPMLIRAQAPPQAILYDRRPREPRGRHSQARAQPRLELLSQHTIEELRPHDHRPGQCAHCRAHVERHIRLHGRPRPDGRREVHAADPQSREGADRSRRVPPASTDEDGDSSPHVDIQDRPSGRERCVHDGRGHPAHADEPHSIHETALRCPTVRSTSDNLSPLC